MATYGDMVTLLLCFFVLLFAMSTTDAQKFKNAMMAFRGTFGLMDGGKTVSPEDFMSNARIESKGSEFKYQAIAKKLKGDFEKFAGEKSKNSSDTKETDLSKVADIKVTERGIEVALGDEVLFDTAKAELRPGSKEILNIVYDTILSLENEVVVEGHTDSRSINTVKFPSNWELSGARAASVVRYFLDKNKKLNKRVSIAGYAATRPVAVNTTVDGRQKNRRVNIVILKSIEERVAEKLGETEDISK
jgi:chemotaxis protein MotB